MSLCSIRSVTMLLLLPVVSSVATAQNKLITFKGEFVGARGKLMQVRGEDKKDYLVLMPDTPVPYTGTAMPGWLRQGMLVRFEGKFNSKGASTEPVVQLEAFSVDQRRLRPEQMASVTPGIYPTGNGGGEGLFGGDERAKPKVPPAVAYKIIGRVAGLSRKGELSVLTAPRQAVSVQLTEESRVKVSLLGAEYARPGDMVSVDGYYVAPAETHVTANTLRIAAKGVLGQVEPKENPRRRRRGAKDEEEGKTQSADNSEEKPAAE